MKKLDKIQLLLWAQTLSFAAAGFLTSGLLSVGILLAGIVSMIPLAAVVLKSLDVELKEEKQ